MVSQISDVSKEKHKFLGIIWNINADYIVFDLREIAREEHQMSPTKRQVVSTVSKFFVPLGLLSTITVQFKVLFQALCEAN